MFWTYENSNRLFDDKESAQKAAEKAAKEAQKAAEKAAGN